MARRNTKKKGNDATGNDAPGNGATGPLGFSDGENRLLTAQEVAEILHISESFAYDQLRKGKLPSVRVGRRLLCPLKALLKWIEQNTTTPEVT